jgi:hypothetical protein
MANDRYYPATSEQMYSLRGDDKEGKVVGNGSDCCAETSSSQGLRAFASFVDPRWRFLSMKTALKRLMSSS